MNRDHPCTVCVCIVCVCVLTQIVFVCVCVYILWITWTAKLGLYHNVLCFLHFGQQIGRMDKNGIVNLTRKKGPPIREKESPNWIKKKKQRIKSGCAQKKTNCDMFFGSTHYSDHSYLVAFFNILLCLLCIVKRTHSVRFSFVSLYVDSLIMQLYIFSFLFSISIQY